MALTEREIEIIQLMADGHTNKKIASMLGLSIHTIRAHNKHIAVKTGIQGRAGFVGYGFRNNLIT